MHHEVEAAAELEPGTPRQKAVEAIEAEVERLRIRKGILAAMDAEKERRVAEHGARPLPVPTATLIKLSARGKAEAAEQVKHKRSASMHHEVEAAAELER